MNNLGKNALERAKRLQSLRKMIGLSRTAFAKRIGVPASNFQNWEGPRYGGLTEKGAEMIVRACWKVDIDISIEWLMYGVGFPPVFLYATNPKAIRQAGESYSIDEAGSSASAHHGERHRSVELAKISRELEIFKKHYGHDVLDLVVSDTAMEPCYKVGDWLAGKRFLDPTPFVGHECIIETAEKKKILRVLKSGSRYGSFDLEQSSANGVEQAEHDVEVLSIAPIMWIRRVNGHAG